MAKNKPRSDTDKLRVQLDFSPSTVHTMDQIMAACEFKTRKDLFENAFTILLWAVNAAQEGKDIASYEAKTGVLEKVKFPALQAAAYNQGANVLATNSASQGRPVATVVPLKEKTAVKQLPQTA